MVTWSRWATALLGLLANLAFREAELHLESGDGLLLFTHRLGYPLCGHMMVLGGMDIPGGVVEIQR